MELLKNCKQQHLVKAFLSGFKPRPKLTGSEWSDSYRIVAPGTSPEPGPWSTARVPYLKEPLDMATKRTVEKVVIMAASQIAKSELLLNVMGYYIDQEPSPILMLQPTVEMAEVFSKERIEPTIQASKALLSKIGSLDDEKDETKGTSRKSSNTIRLKKFHGGFLALVGSNSPAGLASRPIRVLLCDEIDRYGQTKEGDPLKLAIQRTTNFANRKIVLVSTPTTTQRADGPTIYSEYELSDKRQFFIKCPYCGHNFVMKWKHVIWRKDNSGKVISDSIKLICPHCLKTLRDKGKIKPSLLESGYWKATANSKIVGFHISSLYSPWVLLENLVTEFVQATSSPDKDGLQEFLNLKLGEPWEEFAEEQQSWEQLYKRCEYYPENGFSNEVLFLTAGVDVQRDRIECSIYGWGVGQQAWLISHTQLFGDPLQDEVWSELDEVLLESNFVTENGKARRLVATFIDSGDGTVTEKVYKYTKQRERYNIVSIKGRGGWEVPFINKPSRAGEVKAMLYVLGVDAGKSIVTNRLAIKDSTQAGYIHFPKGVTGIDEEFFKQLTAETIREQKNTKGYMVRAWHKIRDRNEALDCLVYATAAMKVLNPNFEKLKEKLK